MIKREAQNKIEELQDKYFVILITGPRQSGKTTLAKHIFADYTYKNLENPDQKLAAEDDPKRFLNLGSGEKMVIDEIQEVPELASYIQTEVDENKITSQYVLTGSQNFQISQTVTQSLAGRVAQFELLPLTFKEIEQEKSFNIDEHLVNGSYPGRLDYNTNVTDFYRDYVNTYITRDVRTLQNIGDLSDFLRFMRLLAGRVGQFFNATELANEIGVNYKTIQKWLTVLEASYICMRLEPYYENFGKRLIKSHKVYFYDTGLVNYLLGVNSLSELQNHYLYGSIFENFIITEYVKNIWNHRRNEKLYFWRDNKKVEIDLLIDKGLDKELIEIKSSRTFKTDFLKNIKYVKTFMQEKYQVNASVVYQGTLEQKIHDINILNWRNTIPESNKS
ncbi:MAG: ATP-binding protein [Candidatus Dojkabacteria bacterium]